MSIYRKKYQSDKISDDYLKNKFKQFEKLLKSMKSKLFEERPDCCDVLEERNKWIMSLDNIRESEEFKEFVDELHNNLITDDSIVKYAKYHLNLN